MEEGYLSAAGRNLGTAAIHGVALTEDENRIVYAFSVNDSSGIYSKLLDDEIRTEAHIVSANDVEFMSVSYNSDGEMLAAVQVDSVTSRIALFPKGAAITSVSRAGTPRRKSFVRPQRKRRPL